MIVEEEPAAAQRGLVRSPSAYPDADILQTNKSKKRDEQVESKLEAHEGAGPPKPRSSPAGSEVCSEQGSGWGGWHG